MAEEEMNFLGYACDGSPMYAPKVCPLSHEEMRNLLLETLDIKAIFNGKEYFDYGDGRYFETDDDGNPDIFHILTIDEDGIVLKDDPF